MHFAHLLLIVCNFPHNSGFGNHLSIPALLFIYFLVIHVIIGIICLIISSKLCLSIFVLKRGGGCICFNASFAFVSAISRTHCFATGEMYHDLAEHYFGQPCVGQMFPHQQEKKTNSHPFLLGLCEQLFKWCLSSFPGDPPQIRVSAHQFHWHLNQPLILAALWQRKQSS